MWIRFQTQVWSLGVILYESGEAQVFFLQFGVCKIDGYAHVARLSVFTCLRDSAVCQSMFCLSRGLSR